MIRSVSTTLRFSNTGKLKSLSDVFVESRRVLEVFIDSLWVDRDRLPRMPRLKTETWLSARMQQLLAKQASSCIRSQKKPKHGKRTRPTLSSLNLEFDERFVKLSFDQNSFDGWITLGSLGNKLKLVLPFRKHALWNKYTDEGWSLKKTCRVGRDSRGWMLTVFFEKEAPPLRTEGRVIGVDCGYKKLIAVSDGYCCGVDLKDLYSRIARKRRSSKAYVRAVKQAKYAANSAVKELDLAGVQVVACEALKHVKHKSKFSKQFNNKLQYWSYRSVFDKLQRVCEESGVTFKQVPPEYSSQTCSLCGHVDRNSRKGESFLCTRCGLAKDADLNASEVIQQRGAYGPPSNQATTMIYH